MPVLLQKKGIALPAEGAADSSPVRHNGSMRAIESSIVRQSLGRHEIHEIWESAYRSEANERFYEWAFDAILRYAEAPAETVFLDVGCGPGFHALRLARRGYQVCAVDFSPSVLEFARENVVAAGLQERIELSQQDLISLNFSDSRFERILCWGVLMHVPELERAIGELSRVLAPGGKLIISEANMHSLEATLLRILRRVCGRRANTRRTSAGIEHWKNTPAGPLMTRNIDIGWLIQSFAAQDLRLVKRLPEQFSEAYVKLRSPIAGLVHTVNKLWFLYGGSPRLAADNILILEK